MIIIDLRVLKNFNIPFLNVVFTNALPSFLAPALIGLLIVAHIELIGFAIVNIIISTGIDIIERGMLKLPDGSI